MKFLEQNIRLLIVAILLVININVSFAKNYYLYNEDLSATVGSNGVVLKGDDIKLKLGGRIHLDTVTINQDTTKFEDITRLRRARISTNLGLGEKKEFNVKLDYDVGKTSPGIKNAWASYKLPKSSGLDGFEIKAGNFVAPVTGEKIKSSNDLKLLERSIVTNLTPSFLMGTAINYKQDNVYLSLGYFMDPINNNTIRPVEDGDSYVARVVFSPVKSKEQNLFIATSYEYRDIDENVPSRVRAKPEFGLNRERLIDTRKIENIELYQNFILEAGYSKGPFAVTGTMIRRENKIKDLNSVDYYGKTAEMAYVLTGQNHKYSSKAGAFTNIKTKKVCCAIELVGRYSLLDLNDGKIRGGRQENYTLGMNWYLKNNIKLMTNYVNAKASPNRNGKNEAVEAILSRLQFVL